MTLSVADLDAIGATLRGAFASHGEGSVSPLLAEFGWRELLAADPGTAVPLVFEIMGSSDVTAGALSDVMLHALGPVPGEAGTVVIPLAEGEGQGAGRLAGGTLEIDGVCVDEPGPGPALLALTGESGQAVRLALVALEGLTVEAVGGIDPWLGLRRIQGATARFQLLEDDCSARWPRAVAWGRLALAAQLVGVASTALRLATDHAMGRAQFGRPVGSFQAVQHRLADVLIALEGARAAVTSAGDRPDGLAAMVAKSSAGAAGRVAAANCLQVIAGIGFTWEHPLHRYHKRSLVLDRLLGSADYLPRVIGETLVRLGHAPRLVDL